MVCSVDTLPTLTQRHVLGVANAIVACQGLGAGISGRFIGLASAITGHTATQGDFVRTSYSLSVVPAIQDATVVAPTMRTTQTIGPSEDFDELPEMGHTADDGVLLVGVVLGVANATQGHTGTETGFGDRSQRVTDAIVGLTAVPPQFSKWLEPVDAVMGELDPDFGVPDDPPDLTRNFILTPVDATGGMITAPPSGVATYAVTPVPAITAHTATPVTKPTFLARTFPHAAEMGMLVTAPSLTQISASAPQTYWGSGIGASDDATLPLGNSGTGVNNNAIAVRFKAKRTSTVSSATVDMRTGTGFSLGDGGIYEARILNDDGTSAHKPVDAHRSFVSAKSTSGGGGTLKWDPDVVAPLGTGFTTLNIPAAGGTFTVAAGQKVLAVLNGGTAAVTGRVQFNGTPGSGNVVRIIGGQISRTAVSTTGPTNNNACLVFTGIDTAYVEGVLVDKNKQSGSGIIFFNTNATAPGRGRLYIQNSRIQNIGYQHSGRCGETFTQHGDWLIIQSQIDGVFLDNVTGTTFNTGFLVNSFFDDADGPCFRDQLYFRRVNTRILDTSQAVVGTCETGHNAYWLYEDCTNQPYRATFEDVWATDDDDSGRRTLQELVMPNSGYSPAAGCVMVRSGDTYTGTLTPPSLLASMWTGNIKGGVPPTGDFVASTFTGLNYQSPGYEGAAQSPNPTADCPSSTVFLTGLLNTLDEFTPPNISTTPVVRCSSNWQMNTKKTRLSSTVTTPISGRMEMTMANSAKWQFGYIHGLNSANFDYDWYNNNSNGGAPFHLNGGTNVKVERLKVDGHVWDPIRFTPSVSSNITVNQCWIQDGRDDTFEFDMLAGVGGRATILDTFVDNCHNGMGMRSDASETSTEDHSWVFKRNLYSLAPNHFDSRADTKFSWNNTDFGSMQYWKVETKGEGPGHLTMTIQDCVLRAEKMPKASLSTHRLIPTGCHLVTADSTANVFVWRGPQSGISGVSFVSLTDFVNGDTVLIPNSFTGAVGSSDYNRITNAFRFTDSDAYWNSRVTDWMTNIWNTQMNCSSEIISVGGGGSNVPLGTVEYEGSANHVGSVSDVATAANGRVKFVWSSGKPTLSRNLLYHLEVRNVDLSANEHYASLNTLFVSPATTPTQPTIPDDDLGLLTRNSLGQWSAQSQHTPAFGITYSDGREQGQGYVNARLDTMTPVTGPLLKARQRFVPNKALGVKTIGIRAGRWTGSAPLTVRIKRESDNSTRASGAISPATFPLIVNQADSRAEHAWGTVTFTSAIHVSAGVTASVELETTANAEYRVYCLDPAETTLPASAEFWQGGAQGTTDGATWNTILHAANDMQFYFVLGSAAGAPIT
jgi:hypothetical protein